VRIASLEMIAEHTRNPIERLAVARSDPSIAVRCRMCQLLGRFPEAAAQALVTRLLEDASPQVRAAALVTTLTLADSEQLRAFAIHWTKATPDTQRQVQLDPRAPAITRRLANLLLSGGDSTTREHAVIAIAALASEGYEQLLLPVLRDPRSPVRLAAARALSSSVDTEIRRQLDELVLDPESAVRDAVRGATIRVLQS
jgi:HEAT repeat protein